MPGTEYGWDSMNKKEVKLYKILLPIWILVFWPSWLWLILIPANYLIDRLVLRWSLGEMPDKGAFCRKHTWKICIANIDRGQTQCRHGSGPVTELACVFLIPCRKVIFCNLVEKLGFFLENE